DAGATRWRAPDGTAARCGSSTHARTVGATCTSAARSWRIDAASDVSGSSRSGTADADVWAAATGRATVGAAEGTAGPANILRGYDAIGLRTPDPNIARPERPECHKSLCPLRISGFWRLFAL